MIHDWVRYDNYDFLYLVALGVLWFVARIALSRRRSGIPWKRNEIVSYTFLGGGTVILVIAGLFDPLSALRLPIFVVGVGCMLWAFLTLRRIV